MNTDRNDAPAPSNFIRNIIEDDNRSGKQQSGSQTGQQAGQRGSDRSHSGSSSGSSRDKERADQSGHGSDAPGRSGNRER